MKPDVNEELIQVVFGPTASGKTKYALGHASKDPTVEIINADAFQIYKGFDIGTAKVSLEIREKVPHHLIDICKPSERFSAAEYSRRAREVIVSLRERGVHPIVVGGTGLYIDALFFGLSPIEVSDEAREDAEMRYRAEYAECGFEKMHEGLRNLDPVLYEQVDRERNPLRLERAYVHYYASGVPLGEARKLSPIPFEYRPKFTLLDVSRDELRSSIERRVDQMLAAGWEHEVAQLINSGIKYDDPAMRAIGYREIADLIAGTLKRSEMRERIVIKTAQYAKRQITWMKKYNI